ncbi:MAG: 2-oxoglutarate dehydrogenase E2 component (dihydrolipoamide succinyltransferase) [bacterium]|nr:MAG: 2-oxoglutarate dehydrogenase E2 component (dihydrolipoamide succinyltransferase) [bacterium]
MATDVIMPQMGESIAEGTIVKWIKKIGDEVKRDEPLFEISTDKVDAEIPSPTAGVLVEILASEGQTVPINTVVARIDAVGSKPPAPPAPKTEEPKPVPPTVIAQTPVAPVAVAPAQPVAPPVAPPVSQPVEAVEKRSSPLVRKIARENSVNINEIDGSGLAGRVTKNDILSHVANKETVLVPVPTVAIPQPVASIVVATPPQVALVQPVATQPSLVVPPFVAPIMETYRPGDRVEIVSMSPMRKKISEHMVASRRISAHVQSFFEIDMTKIAKLRDQYKDKFLERHGVKLTFTPFIMKAVVDALGAWPIMNASVDGDNIVYKKDINLGIAVALDWGLIVPVVKNAEERNLVGLTRAMNDLAARARKKQLKPDEVQGGTFTITNPGVFGSLFGTPIINQPQVAIMGVGTIEKRLSVMEDDSVAICTKSYFSISFDHRVVDGAVADQFMSNVKRILENFEASEIG